MSLYGSHNRLPTMSRRTNSRPDLSSASFTYSRTEGHAGGNGYYPEMMDGSNTYYNKTISGGHGGVQSIHQKAQFLQSQFKDYLNKAEFSLQSGTERGVVEAERFLEMSTVVLEKLQGCGIELQQMGQSSDNVMRSVDQCRDQLRMIHFNMNGQAPLQRKNRGGSGGHDGGRSFQEAMAWISQQKRLIETAPWGDDQAAIEQQINKHSMFHSSIQRCPEVERARNDLDQKGERSFRHALDQEWDSLQKMSCSRSNQLRDLLKIIEDISREIIWVNEREEEELVFDWGDKDIDNYIPRKQESYSSLMRDLEKKEKDLNKLNQKVENVMKNNHPASDKIEAYKDTLQTQWSWLLQITKCIDTHLKENAAYSQFFKEANETYGNLQKVHENIRKKFTCSKGTPLEKLIELIKNLEREKEVIMENKRQVQHLVNKSKSIVRLKPRNTHEKSSSPMIVKALCDYKQDQKQILKGNEAILKDNSQRSKWHVTGPGGLDMLIPSVCLIVPPPNPLSISLANKNEQYFEAIMGVWNQLFINIKSLISWRYCLRDIERINSLTIAMLAKMRPDEYRKILKSLETRYQEFMRSSVGSEMFAAEDKMQMEHQFSGAQDHYDKLVVQLPTYIATQQGQVEIIQRPVQTIVVNTQPPVSSSGSVVITSNTATNVSQSLPPNKSSSQTKIISEVTRSTSQTVQSSAPSSPQTVQSPTLNSSQSLTLLSELHALRQKLELAESGLTQHIHLPLGENGVQECSQRMLHLEHINQDIDLIHDEYVRLREKILIQLEGMKDTDKAKFLRSELNLINHKIGSLEGFSSNYIQRLKSLQALLLSLLQAEDIIKVHEARLTEKETSSLELRQLEDYQPVLKKMKQELEQKRDVLKRLELELGNAERWNDQIGQSFHKCDVDLSRYREQVTQMTDRWRRTRTQIDTRMWDLEKQQQQLKNYKQTSVQVNSWIDDVQQRQDSLLSKKFNDLKTLNEHLNQQKTLYSEIKGKKDKVDDVVRDAHTCASSIADYEVELASYSAGLETLLNIPIKRTMLQSPATIIREEAIDIQSRYIELFTRSGDYYKYLGDLQKNMEELKMSNTRIDLLEEELRRLKEEAQDRAQKNRSLEDTLARYHLELSQSKDQLLSMEEVKRTQALQCSATKDNLDTTYSQVKDLDDKVMRLTYALDEEKRKRRLAEERYTNQQEEYDRIVRKRQNELDDVSRSKLEIEKTIKEKEREIERLRMQLDDEEARRRTSVAELSKVRNQCSLEIDTIRETYESEIHVTKLNMQKLAQKKDDSVSLRKEYERLLKEKLELEEELSKMRLSLSQSEEMRRKVEEEVPERNALGTEEERKRRELEIQIETFIRQREESELRLKEAQGNASRVMQEKDKEITLLMREVEEERCRRRALEMENGGHRKVQEELQAKYTSSMEVVSRIKASEEEMSQVKVELEREKADRAMGQQHISKLVIQIKASEEEMGQVKAELEREKADRAMGQQHISKLVIQIKASEEERGQLKAELEREKANRAKGEQHISKLEIQIKASEKDRGQLKAELEREKANRAKGEQHISKLEIQIKTSEKDRGQLKAELEREKADRAMGQQHISKLEIQIKTSEEERHQVKAELEREKAIRAKGEQHISKLEIQIKTSEEERHQVKAELEREKAIRAKGEQHISKLEIQIKTSEEERDQVKAELEREKAIRAKGEQHISKLEIQIKTSEEERGQVKAELEREKAIRAKDEQHISKLEIQIKTSEKEMGQVKAELERERAIRAKGEQHISKLEIQITDLQRQTMELEAKAQRQVEAAQSEAAQRKKVETDLERSTLSCEEHITTITLLKREKGNMFSTGQQAKQELQSLHESLNKTMRDYKAATEKLDKLTAELKALQQQLNQEQARVREANLRNETLYKTIEEKSKVLNDNRSEIQKLQGMTESLTKLQLRLEEELRVLRQKRDELKKEKESSESHTSTHISSLEVQLQTSGKKALEFQSLINDLSRERDKFKAEIEKIQKQAAESSGIMHESQTRYKELLVEKESLLLRIKTVEQEKGRAQKNEDELSRIRVSLESEMRQKQCLQDELDQLRKDFNYWKSQYELKDGLLRQCDTDKGKAERDLSSLRSEIERLTAELRAVEERYKGRLLSSEGEVSELTRIRGELERELQMLRKRLVELESKTVVDHAATITSAVPSKSVTSTTMSTTTVTTNKTPGIDMKVQGIRGEVTITELVESNLLNASDVKKIDEGLLTSKDIENKLKTYLHGSDCIAGIFDEKNNRTLPIYLAMKEGLLRPGTTLELLEAQASSGFMIDPINNLFLTVEEAWKRNLIGREFKSKLMSAERAVTGYSDPRTGKIISLFQAMEKGIIEKGHGIRLLEAQIASGGIIDPKENHRIDVDVAYRRGYFDKEMNDILSYEGDDTKGFFDPNTEENLTYLQLKERCVTDEKTGLVLLPLWDKSKSRPLGKSSQKNTLRKRRVVIVDPDTQKEMTVREAYHRELIDYDTFLELSEQECEWEEITITASDGSTRLVVVDRKTGKQYDIQDFLDKGLLSQKAVDQYRSGALTLTEFADQILNKSNMELSITSTNAEDVATCSSPTHISPSSPTARKRFSSISITLSSSDIFDDLSPIAAIFDTETIEKITISEALRRGIVDTITAQRLLEAQACTGGIINPGNGQRLTLQDAVHQGIIDEDMAAKLKPAQKAFQGFEDVKTKRRMSAAEAMKEKWLPHEAGLKFLEFQYLTGGLIEPGTGRRVSIEEAIKNGWLEGRDACKLQDTRLYIKNLTCPKTKLKISYKEALDNCMVEETNGMKMIQATSISSKGISSPYNVRSNPGSRSSSRTGSRNGSRRGSVDLTTSSAFNFSSSSFSSSTF